MKGNPIASAILERCRIDHGRDHQFDFPSKLAVIVNKTDGNDELTFVMRGLFATILRKKQIDPYSLDQLDGKTGAVNCMCWYRKYALYLLKTYGAVFQVHRAAAATASARSPAPAAATARGETFVQKVERVLQDPLTFFEVAEGPTRMSLSLLPCPISRCERSASTSRMFTVASSIRKSRGL